jgi:uncharacterized membrane protein
MKQDQLRMILLLISPGVVLSFSVLIGNPTLGLGILFSGGAAIFLFRNKIESIQEDNRIRQISQQASWATFQITVIGFAIGGATLIALEKTIPVNNSLGNFMAYTSCGLLVLYTFFYIFYRKRIF